MKIWSSYQLTGIALTCAAELISTLFEQLADLKVPHNINNRATALHRLRHTFDTFVKLHFGDMDENDEEDIACCLKAPWDPTQHVEFTL